MGRSEATDGGGSRLIPPALPKGGGAVRGLADSFESNAFTGTIHLSLPIPATPCRDSAPALSIDYDSASGNGPFGVGFHLSTPSISRQTDLHIPTYTDDDVFAFSGRGDLVPKLEDGRHVRRSLPTDSDPDWWVEAFRARQEESFERIERWTNTGTGDVFWRVVERDNTVHFFGRSPQARLVDPDDPSRIFSWLLETTRDARGNESAYTYVAEDGLDFGDERVASGRDPRAQKYLQQVAYGPYEHPENGPDWHFKIVFDYGERDLGVQGSIDFEPTTRWLARPDPFSTYKPGFELRTQRLCHGVLLFHSFPHLEDAKPQLVRMLRLEYDENTSLSRLQRVTELGVRPGQGGAEHVALPPLELAFSPFDPSQAVFQPLKVDDGILPGLPERGGYQMTALDGEGLPGMLYSDPATRLYWPPRGPGELGPPQTLDSFPRQRPGPEAALADVTGDGLPELVVSGDSIHGVYPRQADGSWGEFQPYAGWPTVAARTGGTWRVDMTGDGRADLLLATEPALELYPSRGLAGFDSATTPARPPDLPLTIVDDERQAIRFADPFGDGGSHVVRIRNGSFECWPSLGYGRFGHRVELASAPHFADDFDPDRLFLADVDGSGTADLIYAESDRLTVWLNQSGNGFAEPFDVPLPQLWSQIDQLSFADIDGKGTDSAVVSAAGPDLAIEHRFCDFAGGRKPYLLHSIDNNLGAQTQVTYTPSTRFFLADQRAGRPWITRVPFPVQLVETIERVDRLAGSRHIQRFAYHDGYFDGEERRFRGFGFVETWDSEDFEGLEPDALTQAVDDGTFVAPAYTRTWFHTGSFAQSAAVIERDETEFFQGDDQAVVLPGCLFDPEIAAAGPETLRDAHTALVGAVWRREVYGLDVWSHPDRVPIPFNVEQTTTYVRLEQPRSETRHASLFVYPQESLTYDYERNPEDPRAEHAFTLEVDAWGNVGRTCQIAYPRRQPQQPEPSRDPAQTIQPQQALLRVTASEDTFINIPGFADLEPAPSSFFLLGVPESQRSFELGGLAPPADHGVYRLEEIANEAAGALGHILPFDQTLDGKTLQARLLRWEYQLYSSPQSGQALAYGQVSPQALLFRSAEAVFPEGYAEAVFGSAVDAADLEKAGFDPDGMAPSHDGQNCRYWWNPGIRHSYATAEQFFVLNGTTDPFGAATRATFDPYDLVPVMVVDAMQNTVTAEIDYLTPTLAPHRLIDENDNISEARFDPLGRVFATSIYGTVGPQEVGDLPLGQYQSTVGGVPVWKATVDDVIADPKAYLQGATSFLLDDPYAWQRQQKPPRVLTLERTVHVRQAHEGDDAAPIVTALSYSDGFGRELETKQNADPGPVLTFVENAIEEVPTETRWLSHGRTVYNNKGAPVKRFEPFYSNTWEFIPTTVIEGFAVTPSFHYDPLLRLDRVDLPDGFLTRIERTAWVEASWDEDDTILESSVYPKWKELPPNERDAFRKALAFAKTPTRQLFDNLGRTILEVESLTQAVRPSVNPVDEDSSLPLTTPIESLVTRRVLDIEGNELSSTDPRLLSFDQADPEHPFANFSGARFDMARRQLTTVSVDAGQRWWLYDVTGQLILTLDERGFAACTAYDPLRRKKQVTVVEPDAAQEQTVEFVVYGDEPGQGSTNENQRGHPVAQYDQAGRVRFERYGIQRELLVDSRQLLAAYDAEPSWEVMNNTVVNPSLLEPGPPFTTQTTYDALLRPRTETAPDGTVLTLTYHPQGWLASMTGTAPSGEKTSYVKRATYNARGQRIELDSGNGVVTHSQYDPKTFRLRRITSRRGANGDAGPLQDLLYFYDPKGNVTRRIDNGQPAIFNQNTLVDPLADYTYDSLYRLVRASGREHPGVGPDASGCCEPDMGPSPHQPHVNDSRQLTPYTRLYQYDHGGNLTRLQHVATDSARSFTRSFGIEGPPHPSNRLARVENADQVWDDVRYDACGNLKTLEGGCELAWSYRNTLKRVTTVERADRENDAELYVYDAGGERVRKITRRLVDTETGAFNVEDKIYLGTLEIVRHRQETPSEPPGPWQVERRSTLAAVGQERFAIIHRFASGKTRTRYPLGDLLDSVVIELGGAGKLLTYEEYYPYGASAVTFGDMTLKEYRYSGKERDATGLYDYGARYYAPWLGRWLSPDPAWTIDGLNLYAFVSSNPVTRQDQYGRNGDQPSTKRARVTKLPTRTQPGRLGKPGKGAFVGQEKASGFRPSQRDDTEYPEYSENILRRELPANADELDWRKNYKRAGMSNAVTQSMVKADIRRGQTTREGQMMVDDIKTKMTSNDISRNHKLADSSVASIFAMAHYFIRIESDLTKRAGMLKAIKRFITALTGKSDSTHFEESFDLNKNMRNAIWNSIDEAAVGTNNIRFGNADLNQRILFAYDPNVDASGSTTPISSNIANEVRNLHTAGVITKAMADAVTSQATDRNSTKRKRLSSSETVQLRKAS